MRNYFTKHIAQYLIIFLILAAGLTVVFSDIAAATKLAAVVALALLYLIWGIWHHWEDHKEVGLTTAAEYALVALLILWVLLSVA